MGNELSGKVALVTGAGRGIGRSIALTYAAAGAKVVCVSRTLSEIEATCAKIEKESGTAYPFCADMSVESDVASVFQFCEQTFARLDVVVVNAGVFGESCLVENMSLATWNRIMESNLTSAFLTSRGAIPLLRNSSGGKLILVGSGLGHRGAQGRSVYAASKAGMWMLTQVLAAELADESISVNELIPGPVDTAIHPQAERDRMREGVGTEWFKAPDEVAPLALFLASQPDYGPTAQSYSLMRR